MVPKRKGAADYVDDVSEQEKEEYAAWLEAQSEKNDGADEGEFSVARWLKGRKMAAMSGIKIQYDLDDIDESLTTKSFCPYGDYAAVLESVRRKYTMRGFPYILLTFEVRDRMTEDEPEQVFHPTMVRWLRTSDGRVPKRLEKVLEGFKISRPADLQRMVGKKVVVTIVKGDDFNWNGKKYRTAKIKSVFPFSLRGPQ